MIHFSLKGLPAKIAAGGGWHAFTMNVTDTSDTPVGAVEASVEVNNGQASENGDLFEHAYLEYWDADGGKWLSLKDEGKDQYRETGIIYGHTHLKAHESATLRFRLRIDAEATPGPSYAIGGGTYVDPGKHCTDGTTVQSRFDVLAPGEGGGTPEPSGTPTPSATAAATRGASASPATGSLAETGSSSALPAIAAVGGAAVAIGVGTTVLIRRRKSGSEAA
ncbi:LAETG motif-containing sortase-dependent surface protein [Streptomyces tsukubensis]|uniref:Gram-positive cocci surface proteins LPxTG domain-containing protein n=1 Tax=Streptomyces tsukubensis TaxID=83656 RepID=A0A1V4AFN6_9ACTN|nr:LAETG motif-containing sortase-dependent surface protein [Streptomyces tsukubensis]OON82849.1 hypothetical protein B1H18_02115 [Streptomyces tsukubensis]QFR91975.1 hypothetical protein GBW32_01575 [Streptomyces tsukubensis]